MGATRTLLIPLSTGLRIQTVRYAAVEEASEKDSLRCVHFPGEASACVVRSLQELSFLGDAGVGTCRVESPWAA